MGTAARAAIYTRISLDATGQGLGVARQLEDCLELAERLGWDVVEQFDDNDQSAYNGKRRPAFEALLDAMKRGEIDALICWHTDRLYRSMKDLQRLVDIIESAHIQIRTVQGGELDLSNSNGRMIARILGSVAQQESEHKSERQVRANIQKAVAGHWQSANRTFGYTLDGQPLEPEASAVRKAVVDVLAGKSIQALSREWNAAGLQTTLAGQERKDAQGNVIKTLDGKWNSPRVRRLLINPRYAGIRIYRGKTTQGNWTPLVDIDTHRGLVAYLTNPARITNHDSFERKYIGSGLYVCGICGATMKAAQPGGKRPGGRRYVCRDQAHLARVGERVDDLVTATVLERMTQPDAAKLLANQGVDFTGLSVKREALQRKLDSLTDLFNDDAIDAEQFGKSSRDVRTKLAVVDKQLADATRTSPAAALVAAGNGAWELWQAMSPVQRAQAVDEVAVVTIQPAPRGSKFNPEFVDVVWRRGEEQ